MAKASSEWGEDEGRDVGRMVDCSQADDRRMIRLVRARRLLYARNNMPVASYYSRVKALWGEVAQEMGWSVADVRRKWSHIRNSYSRHLRNELHGARTGKGRAVSRWYLADELEFLRDHMATDTRPPSLSSYVTTLLDVEKPEQSQDMHPFAQPWFASVNTTPKLEPYDENSSSTFSPDENTSFFQFFRGIHSDYQELPPKKQRLFKRKCLDFLHGLLDEEEPATLYQDNAINLSRCQSDEELEQKICVVEHVVGETFP
ncbi:hypothetical protein ACJJTC_009598 [Scirpophaga incertulas]